MGCDESCENVGFSLDSVAGILEIDMKSWELKNCTILHIIQMQNAVGCSSQVSAQQWMACINKCISVLTERIEALTFWDSIRIALSYQ